MNIEIHPTISYHEISRVMKHQKMGYTAPKDCARDRDTAWDRLFTEVLSGKSCKLKGEKDPALHIDKRKSYQVKETARTQANNLLACLLMNSGSPPPRHMQNCISLFLY